MLTNNIDCGMLRPNEDQRNAGLEVMAADNLTASGSHALACTIERYWRARGYRNVRPTRHAIPGIEATWYVRSNLVGGLPPGVTGRGFVMQVVGPRGH